MDDETNIAIQMIVSGTIAFVTAYAFNIILSKFKK